MVLELGKVKYCNIKLKLFKLEIDGEVFGLVKDSENKAIISKPSSGLWFQEPWNGEYYT